MSDVLIQLFIVKPIVLSLY